MAFVISEDNPVTYAGPVPDAADVVVIGGGVIGVCTALRLARVGQRVVLCEKGRIACEQSSRNWGWIRQQARDPDELPIMVESARIWKDLAAETNVDIGLRQTGIAYMATSEGELDRYRDWMVHAAACGLDTKVLSRAETAALSPAVSKSYAGALYTASDMRAEPWVAVPALAGIAARDGAVLVENCAVRVLETTNGAVSGVVTEQGRIAAPRVVVAGGAWSSLFLRAHGIEIPQLSVRASVVATERLADIGSAGHSADRLCWQRRADGGYTLAVGGFHEFFIGPDAFRALPKYLPQLKHDPFGRRYLAAAPKGYPDAWGTKRRWGAQDVSPFEQMRVLDPRPNMKKMHQLAQDFSELFPGLGPVRLKKAWAGLIDTMPDEVPVVDHAESLPGLIVGTGFSGHGFGIGPGMGRVLADLAMGRDPGFDLRRFRLSRFSDGSRINLVPIAPV
ncbi:MAG: NAD(P)/FAD-dependent oxidoreductase [Paracoccaceae bacterium]